MIFREKSLILIGAVIFAQVASADALVPVHTIRAGEIVHPEDLIIKKFDGMELTFDPREIYGREAKRVLFAGKPVSKTDFVAAALVERNQIVSLIYNSQTMTIETEGRALDRGAEGDILRVINLVSRATVTGKVTEDGSIWVTSKR